MDTLPANPLSIELSVSRRRLWWHVADEDDQPERWDVSADIVKLGVCGDAERHVADLHFVAADLSGEQNLLDSMGLGEWALEFIAETIIDPATGRLCHELEQRISPGPPRMVVLRRVEVAEPWRRHGLAWVLIASALRVMAPTARLAACRVSPTDYECDDRVLAELESLRAGVMLEKIGFERWHEVHIVDPRNPALVDAGIDLLTRWWPHRD